MFSHASCSLGVQSSSTPSVSGRSQRASSYANLFLAIIAAFACCYLDISRRSALLRSAPSSGIGLRLKMIPLPFVICLLPQEFVLELCETCHLNNYLICMAAIAIAIATAIAAVGKCTQVQIKRKKYKLESKVLRL